MLVILLGIYSCKKDQGINSQPVSFAEKLAGDESFEKLNNAINRFDPEYLILVYHDTRTPREITETSFEILKKLDADPTNTAIQKELAEFYHLNSFQDFSIYSKNISDGIKELDTKFNFTKEVMANNKTDEFLNARALYARNIYNRSINNQSGPHYRIAINSTGTNWEEYVDDALDYFRAVMNQGLMAYDEEGGGGCNGEPCCEKKNICRNTAWSTFLNRLAIYGGSGLAAGAAAGFKVGSIAAPVTGAFGPIVTIGGGFIGALGGGVAGTIIAWGMYRSDLDNCDAQYRLCVTGKNE